MWVYFPSAGQSRQTGAIATEFSLHCVLQANPAGLRLCEPVVWGQQATDGVATLPVQARLGLYLIVLDYELCNS